ncbi:hypothetical protein [Vibrio tubiashii]|uniref:hypothetical protein n=1 Tax=Vibrio tubiashii TaxID=29498 RepID=UPI00349EAFEE
MAIKIKQCELFEVDELLKFIDNEWKKDHIFTRDRELFDWQHKSEKCYNFVLAKEGEEILGVLGYIPTSQYSPKLEINNEIWLAIWKIKDGVNKPGLGLMLLNYLKKTLNNPTICSLGLSKEVVPIYKALKYQVGTLSHRAFFNQDMTRFSIASPNGKHKVKVYNNNFSYEIVDGMRPLSNTEESSLFTSNPKKDREYLEGRYFNHPRYKYRSCFIYDGNNKLLVAFIFREIKVYDANIARVVDSFGESLIQSKYNGVISKFITDNSFEYLDMVSNLKDEPNSGFLEACDEIIIPNYFEPFIKENVKVDFAYKTNASHDLVIYRGDSDQDRPNI